MADIPGNGSTTSVIRIGESMSGSLEVLGDRDWIRLSLNAGQEVRVDLVGIGFNPVSDTYLRIRDANGNLLYENDDVDASLNSSVAFSAPVGGVYFVEVGAYADQSTGIYQVSVSAFQMPPEYSFKQIADELVSGYWGGSHTISTLRLVARSHSMSPP